MSEVYRCSNCGAANAVGTYYCRICGQKCSYQCMQCGSSIDPSFQYCPVCGLKLYWPQQQAYSTYNTGYYQQQYAGYETGMQKQKSGRKSPLKYLGLLAGIVLIVIGVMLTINSISSPVLVPESPAVSNTPASPDTTAAQNDYITGKQEVADYVKQYTDLQPPYTKALGKNVHLVNNPDARDVSFAELKSFILSDDTDDGLYVEGVRMCGDFAEELHNNAEKAGIQAAFVAIHFKNQSVGHALDAFNTTDLGLVYIDCTGRGLEEIAEAQLFSGDEPLYECDSIAYVSKGNEYGIVSIDRAKSLDYDFYAEYADTCRQVATMLDDYNSEVEAFNQALNGRTVLAEPEYSQFKTWESEIDTMKAELEELFQVTGHYWAEPLGIVETVNMYW
jgi:hypothetical protein